MQRLYHKMCPNRYGGCYNTDGTTYALTMLIHLSRCATPLDLHRLL
ncbi:hypothetical protein [Coleofasciculus sp.]